MSDFPKWCANKETYEAMKALLQPIADAGRRIIPWRPGDPVLRSEDGGYIIPTEPIPDEPAKIPTSKTPSGHRWPA